MVLFFKTKKRIGIPELAFCNRWMSATEKNGHWNVHANQKEFWKVQFAVRCLSHQLLWRVVHHIVMNFYRVNPAFPVKLKTKKSQVQWLALQGSHPETKQGFLWRRDCIVFSRPVCVTRVLPVNLLTNWISQEIVMGELTFRNAVFALHFFSCNS